MFLTDEQQPEYPMDMTEAVWVVSDDPDWMLHNVNRNVSKRKIRLFACACCRLVWHLLSDRRSRNGVEVSERYADGFATQQELETALFAAQEARNAFQSPYLNEQAPFPGDATFSAPTAAIAAIDASAFSAVAETGEIKDKVMYRSQASLIRDIFGNPFRPVTINAAWLTPTVLTLAQAAYDIRRLPPGTLDNTRLAALAAALEDAGCDNADILDHCRQPGGHVRGCWVLDLLLGIQ